MWRLMNLKKLRNITRLIYLITQIIDRIHFNNFQGKLKAILKTGIRKDILQDVLMFFYKLNVIIGEEEKHTFKRRRGVHYLTTVIGS